MAIKVNVFSNPSESDWTLQEKKSLMSKRNRLFNKWLKLQGNTSEAKALFAEIDIIDKRLNYIDAEIRKNLKAFRQGTWKNPSTLSNLSNWTKFYNSSSDRYGEESYKINDNNIKYQILWIDTKRGKPYLLEIIANNENHEVGFFATPQAAIKKAITYTKTYIK